MVQKLVPPDGRELVGGLRHATTRKLCQPAVNVYLFSNQGSIRHRKKRDGLCFHLLCPRNNGTLNLTAPAAIRLWENISSE